MEFWNQGWVGIVAGAFIGVAISYVFYVLAKRDPLLCEAVRASRVIGLSGTADFSEHVAVTFRGEKIPQLSVATVTVWNAGSATLTSLTIPTLQMRLPIPASCCRCPCSRTMLRTLDRKSVV